MKMYLHNKRITVGIPTFNEENNILKFFESLKEQNLYSKASAFIAFWLRSVRLNGISQYTTMGRALALYLKDVKDLEIPNNIIAIDLYLQCKILEKQKDVFYCDDAIIYFQTPLTSS